MALFSSAWFKKLEVPTVALLIIQLFVFNNTLTTSVTQAAGFSVTIVGATATQAILSYISPDPGSCSVAVSESSNFSPLVHDVDPALFTGSNLDSRAGSVSNGTNRIFVVGKRTSDVAADGKLYSRALQTATTHYYQVTCGGQTAIGSFQTMNLPLGNTYPETPPFNANGFGNYAWPTIDWSNTAQTYIDPLSGIQLKRVTAGEDNGGLIKSQSFNIDGYFDSANAWNNDEAATSGSTSSGASTLQNNQPLFLSLNTNDWHYSNMLDLGVRVFGSGTSVDPASRQLSMCLSLDSGQTCYTQSVSVTLPEGVSQDIGLYPQSFPAPGFGGWGKVIPLSQIVTGSDMPSFTTPAGGTANISGGVMVSNGGAVFPTTWKSGTKILIQNSSPTCAHNLCTIASVGNSSALTLQENLSANSVSWQSADFGVRVIKSGGSGSVTASFNYDMAWAFQAVPWTDNYNCSKVPVSTNVDATGAALGHSQSGYLCWINSIGSPKLYFVGDNGDTRFLSFLAPPIGQSGVPTEDQLSPLDGTPARVSFDQNQGNVLYALQKANGGPSVYKITYSGDYRAFSTGWKLNPGGDIPYQYDNMDWTNVTPPSQNLGLNQQIQAEYPQFDFAHLGGVNNIFGPVDNQIVTSITWDSAQDSPCWTFVFNVNTGRLVTGFNSWDGTYNPSLRWASCHSVYSQSGASFIFSAHNIEKQSGNYGGWYDSKVIAEKKSGTWDSSDTSLGAGLDGSAGYDAGCPTDIDSVYASTGATGNHCVTVKVTGEPCSVNPGPVEKAISPCPTDPNKGYLQDMEVGDYIYDHDAVFNVDTERMRIVKKTVNSPTDIDLVLQRSFTFDFYCRQDHTIDNQRTHLNGWSITMGIPPTGPGCQGTAYYFNTGANQFFTPAEGYWSRGHNSLGVGNVPGEFRIVSSSDATQSLSLNALLSADTQFIQNPVPGFAGALGLNGGLQGYPENVQFNATGAERDWKLDNHHIYGAGIVTNALQPGTSSVYKVNYTAAQMDYKKIPLEVWAGPNLLKDKSMPDKGNTLTDADAWHFCYAYTADECRAGSNFGDLFVAVPQAESMVNTYCPELNSRTNTVCAIGSQVAAANIVQGDVTQNDPTGANSRSLSMGFSGPGRQFPYASVTSNASGNLVLMPGYNLDGFRTEALLAKLPPFPNHDGIDRTTFVRTHISITPPADQDITTADIKFGYAENGDASSYYCTGRQESCIAGQSSDYKNYSFASESLTPVACTTGCAVDLPTIPQRITYYSIEYKNNNGNVVATQQGVAAELTNITAAPGNVSAPSSTAVPPSGGGGGGGGGTYIPNPTPTPSSVLTRSQAVAVTKAAPVFSLKLINNKGVYYLIKNGYLHGITNPGILTSYGLTFSQAKPPTSADLVLPVGDLLTPSDGALVLSREDQTVYLISNGQRHSFTSAKVFTSLGFKFSSVLTVTNPELHALPLKEDISKASTAHLPGVDLSYKGAIFWLGLDGLLHPFPSVAVYNSWRLSNDFTRVVPANSQDINLPIGSAVQLRILVN